MRNVRQMVKRVERAGYTTEVRRVRDLDPAELAATHPAGRTAGAAPTPSAASRWRWAGSATRTTRAASLVSAHKDGVLRAFLHFVPWGEDGISLDLMRRDRSADPGLNELLIVAALQAAPRLGVRRVSLNFAVFRSALERGERLGAGPVSRAWRALLVFASRWFQIESLYRFNAKFAPTWVPRFLVYPAVGDLPRIGVAALEAEAFIVWPQLRPHGPDPPVALRRRPRPRPRRLTRAPLAARLARAPSGRRTPPRPAARPKCPLLTGRDGAWGAAI